MLTAGGFGGRPTPFAGDLVEFVVLRGMILDGPKRPGDVVMMNPKSQSCIELMALGKIKRLPDPVVPAQETNRAAGIENGTPALQKRGRKKNG